MRNAENVALTTRKPENTFKEMLNAFGDSLSDLTSSDDEEDGEDEDDNNKDTELGKQTKDGACSWAMRTILKIVLQCLNGFQQKQMKLYKLTQPRWGA
jgi:hypothetical protein